MILFSSNHSIASIHIRNQSQKYCSKSLGEMREIPSDHWPGSTFLKITYAGDTWKVVFIVTQMCDLLYNIKFAIISKAKLFSILNIQSRLEFSWLTSHLFDSASNKHPVENNWTARLQLWGEISVNKRPMLETESDI